MNLRVFYLTRRGLSDGYDAVSFRRVCNALCFARLGVLPFASCCPSFCRD